MRMVDYFDRGWRCAPDRPAFIDDRRILTWREVNDLLEPSCVRDGRGRLAGPRTRCGVRA